MNTIVVEVLIALISVVSSTDKNLTRQHVGSDVIITRVKITPPPKKAISKCQFDLPSMRLYFSPSDVKLLSLECQTFVDLKHFL